MKIWCGNWAGEHVILYSLEHLGPLGRITTDIRSMSIVQVVRSDRYRSLGVIVTDEKVRLVVLHGLFCRLAQTKDRLNRLEASEECSVKYWLTSTSKSVPVHLDAREKLQI